MNFYMVAFIALIAGVLVATGAYYLGAPPAAAFGFCVGILVGALTVYSLRKRK